MTELPDKPSELIRLALKDLALVEADPGYEVGMRTWHQGTLYGSVVKCEVCFAGAVMAMTLHAPRANFKHANFYPSPVREKLYALNHLRLGEVWNGLSTLGIPAKRGLGPYFSIPEYAADPAGFRRAMEELAGRLEEAEL